jgi:hypothetical protein
VSTPLSAITIRDTPDKIAIVEQLLTNTGILPAASPPEPRAAPSGNGGPALSAQIPRATAIAVDDAGNVFILDSNRIRKITSNGTMRAVVVEGITDPYAADIAADGAGNLYIADDLNHRVRKLSPAGSVVTIAGAGRAGFSGDGGKATAAQLNAPRKLAVDRNGNVYVADSGNGRVRKIGADGIIQTVAGTGVWGYAGDGGPAASARFTTISGLGVDAVGDVYIADGNARVRKVNSKGMITTIAGTGTPGATGDLGPATSAQIEVSGLAVDSAGAVYLTEINRVRKILPDGTIRALVGSATAGFSGDQGPAAIARLRGPRAVAVDGNGALYIADTLNGRVRKITPSGTITTIAGAAPLQ